MRRNIFRWLQVVVVLAVLGMLLPLAGTMQGRSFGRQNPVQPSSVTRQTVWPESATSPSVPILRNTVSVYLPLVFRDFSGSGQSEEWSQHAHDAQRTGYTPQTVPYPWRWRWSWNGPNATGGVAKVTTGGSLPRNVQPVTGGGRVYIAAGVDGVFALSETNGQQIWQRNGIGDIRSTVAYDRDTAAVFVVSANGTLYKLRAQDGSILAQFNTGQRSDLPLPPAVLSDRVIFAMGNSVYAVNKQTMQQIWRYNTNTTVATPPSYSLSRNVVVVATEPDLYVHAINNADGTQKWRVRPVHSSRTFADPTEFRYGWPVIADGAGYVLVKVRLDWDTLWRDWPQTNSGMRQFLTQNPSEQALFVLDLDDGSKPFIANVGHGGYGDGGYMPMGPQPVVKRLANGREVVYTIIRAKHAYDPRWDSHFGEMMLDSETVSGLQGGDVRFIAYDYPPGSTDPYIITDEQPNVSMAGDYLFGAHWEAGFAMRILDRSATRGSFNNKITTQRLATIVASQDNAGACSFSLSHYCPGGLENTRFYDFGFYIYYGQGNIYDRYWREYASWTVSNENVYFVSADGAVVALTSGNPQINAVSHFRTVEVSQSLPDTQPVATISHTEARAWDGRMVFVTGTLRYVFNNGKYVLLGFSNPHQGSFKVLIRKTDWERFGGRPEAYYQVGQEVRVSGVITWYQGDPVIIATTPAQIEVLDRLPMQELQRLGGDRR
ncbi:MAG: PQQ-like beta-propeller repeat protein [Chloroflexus sp.]|nr:PQQ-like beta-propeller repeat protein [Chloroflexus sp.]